jgi:hypothetical protein
MTTSSTIVRAAELPAYLADARRRGAILTSSAPITSGRRDAYLVVMAVR